MAQVDVPPAWIQGIEPGSIHDPFAIFFGEKSKQRFESTLRLWRVLDSQTTSMLRVTLDDLGERLATLFVDSSYFVVQTREGGFAHIFVWCGSEFLRAASEMVAESEDVETTAVSVQRHVAETVYPLLHCLLSYFGSRWTVYYEVEGHESGRFMSLFPLGIEYRLPQIVRTTRLGRRLVQKVGAARLLRVKNCLRGSRSARITEVAPEASALSDANAFVLELFKVVFVWCGKSSGSRLRAKALQFALARKQIKENYTDAARVAVRFLIDGAEGSDAAAAEFSEFWNVLGERPVNAKSVESAALDGMFAELAMLQDTAVPESKNDEEDEDEYIFPVGAPDLYPLKCNGSEVVLGERIEPPLSRKLLGESDLFVLCGNSGSFLWMGKQTPRSSLASSFAGLALLHERVEIPVWAPRCVLRQGNESVWFVDEFGEWPRGGEAVVDGTVVAALEAAELEEAQSVVSENGNVQMWRFRDCAEGGSSKVQVDVVAPEDFGQFYSAHSYVVCYVFSEKMQELWNASQAQQDSAAAKGSHGRRSRTVACVYFWEGRDASRNHRVFFQFRFAQKLLGRLESEYGLPPSQALVRQGHEPPHFLNVFLGDMMIYRGSISDEVPETALFQVLGATRMHTRTVQVDVTARALNSHDCFVLSTHSGAPPYAQYLWVGNGAAKIPRRVETATEIADFLLEKDQQRVKVIERQEPAAFWKALGGCQHYRSDESSGEALFAPRLFRVVSVGAEEDDEDAEEFDADELFSLRQDDLWDEDTMLLDLGGEVLVWVGSLVRDQSPGAALAMGQKYLGTYAGRRSADDVVITQVIAGSEPPMFSAHFADWQPRKAEVYVDPLAKILRLKALVDSGDTEDEDDDEDEDEDGEMVEENEDEGEGEEGGASPPPPPPPPPAPSVIAAPAAGGGGSARTLTGGMLGTVKLRPTAGVPPPKPDARVAAKVPQLFDPSRIAGVKLRSAGSAGFNGTVPQKVPSQKNLRKSPARPESNDAARLSASLFGDAGARRVPSVKSLRPTARSAAAHDKSGATAAAEAVASSGRGRGGLSPSAAALRNARRAHSESAGAVALPRPPPRQRAGVASASSAPK